MNIKTTTITRILLLGVVTLIYSSHENAFTQEPNSIELEITIKNELDIPLEFKEIKQKENLKIESKPDDKINAGETGKIKIISEDRSKNPKLDVIYYINTSDSGQTINIVYGAEFKTVCPHEQLSLSNEFVVEDVVVFCDNANWPEIPPFKVHLEYTVSVK